MAQDEPHYINHKPLYNNNNNNTTKHIQSITTTNIISSSNTEICNKIKSLPVPPSRPVFSLDVNMLKKTLGSLKKISDV